MYRAAIITGGSRSIGAHTARVLAAQGYDLLIGYHTQAEAAQALCTELQQTARVQALAVQADVACRDQVEAMVQAAIGAFGQVDLLVNSAGIALRSLVTDVTEAQWRRILDVDLSGTFYACQCVLPHMIRRKQGKIVNLSSMWGQVGASCEVAYSAAKAGIIGLTKALAKEVGPSNIQVNCVAPGVIDTDMNSDLTSEDLAALCEETPLGRIGTAQDVAQTIAFLASPAADFITGQVLCPNGGFVI